MSFISTIADMCGEELRTLEFRLTVLGSGCVYAEGVKSVKSFSSGEVVLGLKRSCMRISGEGLSIDKLSGGDAIIKGRIYGIERIPV